MYLPYGFYSDKLRQSDDYRVVAGYAVQPAPKYYYLSLSQVRWKNKVILYALGKAYE